MKMKCWACGLVGFLLLCSYARGADEAAKSEKNEAKLPVTKGTVVRVTDKEFVVKSSDEKIGEVAYPLEQVSRKVKLDGDVQKQVSAEEKTKGKYFPVKTLRPADLQPGTKVKMSWGFSHVMAEEKVVEDGNYYQITVANLPEQEKDMK